MAYYVVASCSLFLLLKQFVNSFLVVYENNLVVIWAEHLNSYRQTLYNYLRTSHLNVDAPLSLNTRLPIYLSRTKRFCFG